MEPVAGRPVVTLASLGEGAPAELFQVALAKVLENIKDPNTDAEAKRSVVLKFEFGSNAERDVGEVTVHCAVKLASVKGFQTILYYGKDQGELVAVEQPRQQDLFPNQNKPVARLAVPGKE